LSALFTLRRKAFDAASTIGVLVTPGGSQCWTLEPGPRTPDHPRIPAGDYPLTLRKEGGIYESYVLRFGARFMRGIPLLHVPGRQWIEVHIGNYFSDTEGCALLGDAQVQPQHAPTGHWEVARSENAFKRVYPWIRDAAENGGVTWCVIDEGA
jgi:hypothetical protein